MQDKITAIKDKLRDFSKSQFLSYYIPKEKIVFGCALLVLLGILLYQSLITAQLAKLKLKESQLKTKNKLILFYKDTENNVGKLEKDAILREAAFSKIREEFVDKNDLSKYSFDLRGLVKSFDLRLLSLDFNSPQQLKGPDGKESKYFSKQQLIVSVQGDFRKAMLFLYRLERDNPIFDMDSLSLRQADSESFSVILDLKAYIYILSDNGVK